MISLLVVSLTFKCFNTQAYVKKQIVSFICLNCLEWVMRTVVPVSERLKNLPFPESSTGTVIENPVEVSFKIPPYIYVGDDVTAIKIGVWDS